MKFFAVNGSPRPNCNTAQLLDKALEGVKSICPDAEVERVDLYKIPFNGCKSCFACKKINGRHYGKCVYNDDFKPILNEIVMADGVILGSPIYFSDVTGVMRCFIERFTFPFFVYDEGENIAPKRMPTAFIYTMNLDEESSKNFGYENIFDRAELAIDAVFSKPIRFCSYDTYQFKDYSKYKMEVFNEEDKYHVRKTQFPKDLESAFEIGKKIAIQAKQHG